MSLRTELSLPKSNFLLPQEALLNVYYTASRIRKKAGEFFRLHGLTDVQYNVLALLKHQSGDRGGLTQVELSRMMLVNRANITTLIDRMEKANFVARRPVPDDRRYNIIQLTPHGHKMFDAVEGIYQRKIAEIMSVLEQTELESLVAMLETVRNNLDRVNVE